jgi:hypothetical protein
VGGKVVLRREEPIPALSGGLSHVVMTGLLALAALPALEPGARPGDVPPAVGVPRAATAPGPAPSPAVTGVVSSEVTAASDIEDVWPEDEIVRGREQCMHILSTTAADVEWLEPVKKGPCGLPAPVRLKSVGSSPTIVFDPPVDVNCRMVAALDRWVKTTLQPTARERMRSEVVRIVGAYGYSCRNIYNLPNAKLSQHALANAIDIGGFGFADGRMVRVLKGWGLTARDIKAQQQAKAKALAEAKTKAVPVQAGDGAKAKGSLAGTADKSKQKVNPVTQASLSPPSVSLRPVSKDGETTAAGVPAKPGKEALFLRAIHEGACREFGTVLGPEANDPHRNHFHLDLISRRGRGYCE